MTENTLDFPFHPQQTLFLSQLQSFPKKALILNAFFLYKNHLLVSFCNLFGFRSNYF